MSKKAEFTKTLCFYMFFPSLLPSVPDLLVLLKPGGRGSSLLPSFLPSLLPSLPVGRTDAENLGDRENRVFDKKAKTPITENAGGSSSSVAEPRSISGRLVTSGSRGHKRQAEVDMERFTCLGATSALSSKREALLTSTR